MSSTYEKIATTTLGSAAADVTFTSISGSYTDLVLIMNLGASNLTGSVQVQANSDTGANYSGVILRGNGTTASSNYYDNHTAYIPCWLVNPNTSLETNIIMNIMNYSNTTTYKPMLVRGNRASASNNPGTEAGVGQWRNTAAITSLKIFVSGNIITGSTFTLYGIKAE
jgi:hypothetical protein